MYKKLLCSRIKELRNKNKLTQEAFAEKIGISIDALRNIEYCKSTPRAKTIDSICNAFNISPLVLLLPENTDNSLENLIHYKLKICDKHDINLINGFIDVILSNKEE